MWKADKSFKGGIGNHVRLEKKPWSIADGDEERRVSNIIFSSSFMTLVIF
jgi:hypothetical protein